MCRTILSVAVVSLLVFASAAFSQYEEEPYVEGFIGGNFTIPTGYIKSDLPLDSLNATSGIGLCFGGGYYLKNNLILGLYFNVRNMGAQDLDMKHRVFDFGMYGKYLFSDLTEKSISPYFKLSGGLIFSKLITEVSGEGTIQFRELSYSPSFGGNAALGVHWKRNEFGALFLEVGYQFDIMNGVTGEFKSKEYKWLDNNNFLTINAGILFNIGPKE